MSPSVDVGVTPRISYNFVSFGIFYYLNIFLINLENDELLLFSSFFFLLFQLVFLSKIPFLLFFCVEIYN